MVGDRPKLSELLQSAQSLEVDGKWNTLTFDDGTSVTVEHDVLYSPTRLQRTIVEELQRIPVNDYPDIDAQAGGVHALEEDLDALLVRTDERGDE